MSGIPMENISIERTGINKMLKIWQIKDIETPYTFCGWSRQTKNDFNFNDYKCVLETNENDTDNLEELYDIFNSDRVGITWADNYTGHSMSVSDIVEIDDKFFYCDTIGWKRLDINEDGKVE